MSPWYGCCCGASCVHCSGTTPSAELVIPSASGSQFCRVCDGIVGTHVLPFVDVAPVPGGYRECNWEKTVGPPNPFHDSPACDGFTSTADQNLTVNILFAVEEGIAPPGGSGNGVLLDIGVGTITFPIGAQITANEVDGPGNNATMSPTDWVTASDCDATLTLTLKQDVYFLGGSVGMGGCYWPSGAVFTVN